MHVAQPNLSWRLMHSLGKPKKQNGGDGGIRTLDTRYQVWLLSRELVSATHPRLRIATLGCEGRAIATGWVAIKGESLTIFPPRDGLTSP